MKNNNYLLLFLILFIIPFAVADTSYNNTGAENQHFLVGTGIFNQELTTSIIDSRAFGADVTNIPLVADLDGDGTNEIVVTVGNIVRIIDTNLDNVKSITLNSGSYTTPILLDIDGDGFTEIVLANEQQVNITILKYDGTNLLLNASLSVPHEIITGTERGMISCNNGEDGTESIKCLLVMAMSPAAAGTRNLTATMFNSTDVGATVTVDSTTDAQDDFCLAHIPVIAVADYDADGRDEFVYTNMEFRRLTGENEILSIFYVNDSFDLAYSNEQTTVFDESDIDPMDNTQGSCDDSSTIKHIGNFYTSPLVAEINGETGLETIVGINDDTQDFRIYVFDVNGVELDRHPILFEADGEIISDVMISNVFGDTGTVEYCVLGHDDDEQVLNLLCGSQLTGNIFDSVQFKYNTDGRYNVTKEYPKQNVIAHMGQHSNLFIDIAGEGTTDTTELITSYGVFRLNDDSFNGSFFLEYPRNLEIIYTNIVGDSACIQVDAQQQGSEEIICVEDNQIFYINDGIDNAPAEVIEITYNPCIVDSIIKQNETLQVLVTVTDQNPSPLSQDKVTSNVTVYFGDANQVSSKIADTTSGALHSHSFTLNKTITGGVVRTEGWDSENPTVKDVKLQTFTVAPTGIEFGDSTCTLDFIIGVPAEVPAVEADLTTDATDNAITNAVVTVIGITGLGGTTLWIFFMMMITIFVWFEGAVQKLISGNATLGTIIVFNILAIILGARLGVLSVNLIVVLVVIGVIIIGVFLGNYLMGKEPTAG